MSIERIDPPEPYFTVRSAAKALALKYHALLRAVNLGLIPSYMPFSTRRVVRLSEVEAFIKAHRTGGNDGA